MRSASTAPPRQAWMGPTKGRLPAARVEFHPFGETTRDQADFRRTPPRVVFGAAVYGWWNDDDVAPHGAGAVDLSRVNARRSALGRAGTRRLDGCRYNRVDARAARRPVVGRTLPGRAGAATPDSSSKPGTCCGAPASKPSAGSTHAHRRIRRRLAPGLCGDELVHERHDLKVSLMHRESFNERGIPHARSHTTYVQTQFVF